MSLSKEQQQLVNEWQLLVKDIAEAKKAEAAGRKKLCEELFPDAKLGVNNLDLGAGFKLAYTKKETIKVDEAAYQALKAPKGTFDKTITFKPAYSATGYKHLPEKYQKLLDEALIVSPASPTLKFVEPKEKK